MADQTAKLRLTATNNTEAAFAQMRRSMASVERSTASLQSGFTRLAQVFGGYLGARALIDFSRGVLENADALSKEAQTLGLTTEFLSRLQVQAKLSNAPMEVLTKALEQLGYQANLVNLGVGQNAKYAFEQLGISVKDSNGNLKSTQQLWDEVTSALAGVTSATQRTATMMTLLGARSAGALAPLINTLAQTKNEADELGAVVTAKMGAAAEAVNDNFTRMKIATEGIALRLFAEFSKEIEGATGALVDFSKHAVGTDDAVQSLATGVRWTASMFVRLNEYVQIAGKTIAGITAAQARLFHFDFRGAAAAWDAAVEDLGRVSAQASARLKALQGEPEKVASALEHMGRSTSAAGAGIARVASSLTAEQKAVKAALDAWEPFAEAQQGITNVIKLQMKAQIEANKALEDAAKTVKAEIDPFKEYTDKLALYDKLLAKGKISQDEWTEATFKTQMKIQDLTDGLRDNADATGKASDVARDLGLSFQSAFEDAIVSGSKFSDVLQGIEQDILRLIVRKKVTEPFTTWFTGKQGPLDWLSGLFGFQSGGSFVVGGSGAADSQLVAFRATPGERVTIAPPNASGGVQSFNTTVTVNAPGASAADADRIAARAGDVVEARIRSVLVKERRSGGLLAT